MATILNLGCGTAPLPGDWDPEEWLEIRVDAEPRTKPHVVGNLLDLPLADECADAIYCSHTLEHLCEHQLLTALGEMRRVLRTGGMATIRVPDLQAVAEAVVKDDMITPLYNCPAGDIRPLDVIYGHPGMVAGNVLMAHHTGFTASVLRAWLGAAGFTGKVTRMTDIYELWAEAIKSE